jgi:hypothetical protein
VSVPSRRVRVTLERAIGDDDALRRLVAERLGARVLDVTVVEIDYVRETTVGDVTVA